MEYLFIGLTVQWLVTTCLGGIVLAVMFWVLKRIPRLGLQWVIGGRVKRLRKIKRIRFNSLAVNYEAIKAGAYLVLFMGAIVLTFCLIVFTGSVGNVESGYIPLVVAVYASPVFVFQVLWLEQNYLVGALVRYDPYFHKGKKRVSRAFPRSERRDRERSLRRKESRASR